MLAGARQITEILWADTCNVSWVTPNFTPLSHVTCKHLLPRGADISEEQAKKLEEGITVLNRILANQQESAPSQQLSARHLSGVGKLYLIMKVSVLTLSIVGVRPQSDAGSSSSACGRAIDTLRSVRQSFSSEGRLEQRRNFSPYSRPSTSLSTSKGKKERAQPWTLKVFCLGDTGQCKAPTTACSKILLLGAGLGEHSIKVCNINSCSMEEFRSIIVRTFPKLNHCGGFEMLRCLSNSKDLVLVEGKLTQSVKMLKTVIGSGRLYVRPIQKNLDLTTVEDLQWEADEVGKV